MGNVRWGWGSGRFGADCAHVFSILCPVTSYLHQENKCYKQLCNQRRDFLHRIAVSCLDLTFSYPRTRLFFYTSSLRHSILFSLLDSHIGSWWLTAQLRHMHSALYLAYLNKRWRRLSPEMDLFIATKSHMVKWGLSLGHDSGALSSILKLLLMCWVTLGEPMTYCGSVSSLAEQKHQHSLYIPESLGNKMCS